MTWFSKIIFKSENYYNYLPQTASATEDQALLKQTRLDQHWLLEGWSSSFEGFVADSWDQSGQQNYSAGGSAEETTAASLFPHHLIPGIIFTLFKLK